jgi:hexosaminidase
MAHGLAAPVPQVAVIPRPVKMELRDGRFELTARTQIVAARGAERTGELLADWLATDTGLRLSKRLPTDLRGSEPMTNTIALRIRPGRDGYTVRILRDRVEIESPLQAGLIQGCQTFRQLLAQSGRVWSVPRMDIEDAPRFAWRGLMLDCSRTYLSLSYLKRTVDLMSFYKLNMLHLHLTDDQGWRIEIKRRPRLTEIGSRFAPRYVNEKGGYYSQDDLRQLVEYAGERGVTLIPEIEMPGHSLAALAAYPELSCTGGPFEIYPFFSGPNITEDVFCLGNEETFRLLEDVLDEVAAVFPGPYIHIGGDECPRTRWRLCRKCQMRIRSEGLANEAGLQRYLVARIGRFLAARHKKVIGWDEIVEGGAAPNATVMFWRGMDGVQALAQAGHDVILSPTNYCYLDYKQSELPQEQAEGPEPNLLDKVYSFDPVPAALGRDGAGHVLGAQGSMWTHYARTEDAIDRQIYPRLVALAEVVWTPQELRVWSDFRQRLQVHCAHLTRMGVKLGLNFRPDPGVWADPVRKAP